jgi:hypothetical protein
MVRRIKVTVERDPQRGRQREFFFLAVPIRISSGLQAESSSVNSIGSKDKREGIMKGKYAATVALNTVSRNSAKLRVKRDMQQRTFWKYYETCYLHAQNGKMRL